MEKILLAIDGMNPDKKAFNYAVQLCERIRAELNVLQVIRLTKDNTYFLGARKKLKPAKSYIEGSLIAAAFAEAGEHETAKDMMSEALRNLKKLLPEAGKAGIPCHLTMTAGNPKREIINYVNAHRDVVLTIYDAPQRKRDDAGFPGRYGSCTREIERALPIPLVVVRNH